MSDIRRILTGYQPLIDSERPPHPETKRLERAAANEIAEVQLIVRRRPDGPALKDLDYFQKVPINARTLPSRLEFQEAHGATQADLDAAQEFCRSHGLQVMESNRSRRRVVARGTVAQLNAAFAVELHYYQSPHGKYRGYQGAASLPTALDGIVQAINGLDNRPVPVKHLSADPPIVGLLTPPQVAQLYNFPSGTGLGQTIGIFTAWVAAPMGFQPNTNTNGYQLADVTATLANWGIAASPPTDFPTGSNPGSPTEYYAEPVMDIATATAIAPKASIVVYFMPEWSAAGIISTLTSMIHPMPGDPHPTVLSISYMFSADDDTSFLSPLDYTQIDTLFQDAANKGITVVTGSGDYGAYVSSPTQAQTVYPATDPYVLTCGGTTIGDISGSEFDEYVWNDASGATGGGVSALFPVPPYQATINTLPTRNGTGVAGRGIPDVAGNASGASGYVITLNQNAYPANPPGGGVGGTSIVAPLYAGLVALINETLGENVGFLNPTIYALAPAICRDVTGAAGPTNNDYADPTAAPPVAVTGYPAGVGWDACTGWGSIDGSTLLSLLQGIFQKSMTFIMERTTFGPDEVTATGGVFEQAFFVVVDGLKPSDFPGGGITTTSLTPPPTQAQLNQWAPVIPSPTGPGGVATNITFTPTAVSSEGPSLSPEVQRFTFTYRVTFPDQTAFTMFPALDFPLLLTLNASLAATGGIPDAAAQIELIQGGDPYFSSESNGGLFWLSEDIRVFYAIEGSTLFGHPAPGLGSTPAAARSFIQWIAANLSGPLGTGPNGDTFENTLPVAESTSALSLYPTVPGPQSELNVFNFAIARVRLNGTSAADAAKVRVFFRLFQSQSTTTPYQAPPPDMGSSVVSPLNGPYRQWSDGNKDGRKIPLLGTSPDGTQYVTVPCFASERVTNTSMSTNMWTQSDPTNVTTIEPAADGSTVYAYFGAWLDTNQSDLIFPYQPGANPDGPFTGQTLHTVSQVLNRGGHQCLVVEIFDDEAPIPDSATPASSDKIAQRNLAYTAVANPGVSDSRLATHTFEIRPSLTILNADKRPEQLQRVDELMIDWGNLPDGSIASIYLPALAAADVLALAAKMYPTHSLDNFGAADPHTLQCPTGGITYIPIPKGSAPNSANYAGLLSVQLPPGIRRGQEFKIIVRQVTSVMGRDGVGSAKKRYVYGAFQITIPVSTKSEMLVPEERTLSIMRWIQETIPSDDRWYPVFLRYVNQLAGRVDALGGDSSSVPATQTGIWPGLGLGLGHKVDRHTSFTGKVDGIAYDNFGDFQGFILVTRDGDQHRFESHEGRVHSLVHRAWEQRILTTVVVRRDHPERLIEILLHGAPAPFEE